MSRSFFAALFAACLVLTSLSAAFAATHADFRANVMYSDEGRAARLCGSAMTSGDYARLDIHLGKAGDFTLLVDMEKRVMRVFSQRLKAYVEAPMQGDARSWRDIVRSGASVLMPQTLGMVSLEEKEYREIGREIVQGYAAVRSYCVFRLGFLGSFRDISMDVWESAVFVPFPLKVEVAGSRDTRKGSAWLADIDSVRENEELFRVPQDYTRYSSVMDLILYAVSMF